MLPMLRMMSRYNAWANGYAYEAAAALDEDRYRKDCGAFFRSIHGTLNHLLATDMIWMKRFTGTGEAPDRLDAIVADDFATLRTAREAFDGRIVDYVDWLTDEAIATPFSYVRVSSPEPVTQPLGPALMHLFNHQTHHRGQVHALLTRLANTAPSFDLLAYQRASGDGMR